jgi:hypothetical protein
MYLGAHALGCQYRSQKHVQQTAKVFVSRLAACPQVLRTRHDQQQPPKYRQPPSCSFGIPFFVDFGVRRCIQVASTAATVAECTPAETSQQPSMAQTT